MRDIHYGTLTCTLSLHCRRCLGFSTYFNVLCSVTFGAQVLCHLSEGILVTLVLSQPFRSVFQQEWVPAFLSPSPAFGCLALCSVFYFHEWQEPQLCPNEIMAHTNAASLYLCTCVCTYVIPSCDHFTSLNLHKCWHEENHTHFKDFMTMCMLFIVPFFNCLLLALMLFMCLSPLTIFWFSVFVGKRRRGSCLSRVNSYCP